MKSNEFDKKFDEGEDISEYLDFSKATRPGQEQKQVLPANLHECSRKGIFKDSCRFV
jgi:hypothetical protein